MRLISIIRRFWRMDDEVLSEVFESSEEERQLLLLEIADRMMNIRSQLAEETIDMRLVIRGGSI